MNTEKIKEILGPKADNERVLRTYLGIVQNLSPATRRVLDEYLETGVISDTQFKGWTTQQVMDHTHYDIIMALEEIDYFMTHPSYFESFGRMLFGRL